MTILPSPIPHPLDFSPWDLPGWVYEALEWVIGVEWPEGNEKEVWDLADQWFEMGAALAGPRDDAITAASGVLDGYGHTGSVGQAFDQAWRQVADGEDAPLMLLADVANELGKLVEECGCDIEGAKIEVWIQLGILVAELVGLGIAVVLTLGAASPAAAAAMAATREIIKMIFKRLIGQLAKKALRKGAKEAAEKAVKEVSERGLKSFAKRAGIDGLKEAGEEVAIDGGIQAYQNTTGRRDGLDMASLGMSAVGGFAGGATASVASLGPNASGGAGRFFENVGREVGGEVIAENAASLATGNGFVSLTDAGMAATSGAASSTVNQASDAASNRLEGRLDALSGLSGPPGGNTGPGADPTSGPSGSTGGGTPSGPSGLAGGPGSGPSGLAGGGPGSGPAGGGTPSGPSGLTGGGSSAGPDLSSLAGNSSSGSSSAYPGPSGAPSAPGLSDLGSGAATPGAPAGTPTSGGLSVEAGPVNAVAGGQSGGVAAAVNLPSAEATPATTLPANLSAEVAGPAANVGAAATAAPGGVSVDASVSTPMGSVPSDAPATSEKPATAQLAGVATSVEAPGTAQSAGASVGAGASTGGTTAPASASAGVTGTAAGGPAVPGTTVAPPSVAPVAGGGLASPTPATPVGGLTPSTSSVGGLTPSIPSVNAPTASIPPAGVSATPAGGSTTPAGPVNGPTTSAGPALSTLSGTTTGAVATPVGPTTPVGPVSPPTSPSPTVGGPSVAPALPPTSVGPVAGPVAPSVGTPLAPPGSPGAATPGSVPSSPGTPGTTQSGTTAPPRPPAGTPGPAVPPPSTVTSSSPVTPAAPPPVTPSPGTPPPVAPPVDAPRGDSGVRIPEQRTPDNPGPRPTGEDRFGAVVALPGSGRPSGVNPYGRSDPRQSERARYEQNRRADAADPLRRQADRERAVARDLAVEAERLRRSGDPARAAMFQQSADRTAVLAAALDNQAHRILTGQIAPPVVRVENDTDFIRLNTDAGIVATGPVRTGNRSALTGSDHPPSVDRSRRYNQRFGLRPPLAADQVNLENQMPRNPDGSVVRNADPRWGRWFGLGNDGGPAADPTRGINCVDCVLSFFETWAHGRPRVSAPRTFDAYAEGDPRRPLDGEWDGPGRIEDATGGRFQQLRTQVDGVDPAADQAAVQAAYGDLEAQLRAGGPGSMAFLLNKWEGGAGHAWAAINQNGTILYVDMQTGQIAGRPLYGHSGRPSPSNVIQIDALVVGPDGQPMPMADRPTGVASSRPPLSQSAPPPGTTSASTPGTTTPAPAGSELAGVGTPAGTGAQYGSAPSTDPVPDAGGPEGQSTPEGQSQSREPGAPPQAPPTGTPQQAPEGLRQNKKGRWIDSTGTFVPNPFPREGLAAVHLPDDTFTPCLIDDPGSSDGTTDPGQQSALDAAEREKYQEALRDRSAAQVRKQKRDDLAAELGVPLEDLKADKQADTLEKLRLKWEDDPDKLEKVEELSEALTDYPSAHRDMNRASERLGMIMARHWATKVLGGKLLTGISDEPGRSGTLDVTVHKGPPPTLVVIEAKGGDIANTPKLGSREVSPGVYVEQGSVPYLQWMLENDPDLREALAGESDLLESLKAGTAPISYYLAIGRLNGSGEVRKFLINPDELDMGAFSDL
ncbi:toxin glutamine deamidase domain-containing protein [Plantactinospora sonchi]|uniref:Toxin glutamine deamidase domain-containing protein n=1 Tax=Plantactinospora sonchi TaxID=1544735 RepID=A0ABU7RL92_9ACTN